MTFETVFIAKVAVTLALIVATAATKGDKSFFFAIMSFIALCSVI